MQVSKPVSYLLQKTGGHSSVSGKLREESIFQLQDYLFAVRWPIFSPLYGVFRVQSSSRDSGGGQVVLVGGG